MDGCLHGCQYMDGQMYGCMDVCMDGTMYECMDVCLDGRMYVWVDEYQYTDGCMYVWMEGGIHIIHGCVDV